MAKNGQNGQFSNCIGFYGVLIHDMRFWDVLGEGWEKKNPR